MYKDNIHGAVIMKLLRESSSVHLLNVGQRRVTADLQTSPPTWLLSPPVCRCRLHHHHHLILLTATADTHFTIPQRVES